MPSVLDLAVLSNKIYEADVTGVGPWTRYDVAGSDTWGFYAGVFIHENGQEMVVAFRGTDDIADGVEDFGIFLGQHPNQATQASAVLQTWINRYGSRRRIFLTGHSLGGGLASLMADVHDLPAVTFNAPGMARSSIPFWVPAGISDILALGKSVFDSEPDILHIRAYFDAVSVGTGPRMGIVHNVLVPAPAATASTTSTILEVLPGYSVVRSLIQTGKFVLSQHSMDNIVAALRGNSLYTQEINFSNF